MKTSQTVTPLEALQSKFMEIPKELGAMSTVSIEGLCAAVVACPNQIPENKWTPLIWGKHGAPTFIDVSEINLVRKIVLNYYKHLNAEIKRGNYPNEIHTEFRSKEWKEWVTGFGVGLNLDVNAWKKIKESDNDQAKLSLWVIINLLKLHANTDKSLESTQKVCERQVFRLIPYYICSIASYTQNKKK